MKIEVEPYQNIQLNGSSGYYTTECRLINRDGGPQLGGVDHFMKHSLKEIVNAYVHRLKRDPDWGYPGARYIIQVVYGPGMSAETPNQKSVTVKVTCE